MDFASLLVLAAFLATFAFVRLRRGAGDSDSDRLRLRRRGGDVAFTDFDRLLLLDTSFAALAFARLRRFGGDSASGVFSLLRLFFAGCGSLAVDPGELSRCGCGSIAAVTASGGGLARPFSSVWAS